MPVYRYKSVGVNIAEVQKQVPGVLVLGATGSTVYVDITAPSGSKDDLDETMAGKGFSYDATDPVTTPSEEAGSDTAAALTYAAPGNVGTANTEGSALSAARSDHTHALSEATLRTVASGLTAALAVNGQKVTGLGTPTAVGDAATKAYVDSVAVGLQPKEAVRAATTANIALSGAQTIDGVSVVATDRVLVKNQSTGSENGIYVAAAGAWARAADLDTGASAHSVYAFVSEGTTNAETGWICSTNAPNDIVGTDALTFVQFTGGGGGGGVAPLRTLTAGSGLTGGGDLSADRTFNVGAHADGSIVVNADDVQVGVLATDAQHGSRGGGTQHSTVTTSVNGFMSASDKTKLDGVATSATNTPLASTTPTDVTKAAAGTGVSSDAARADHKHDVSTASGVANPPGTANAEGTATSLARSDHTHAIPAYGSAASTICQGNDARLSDDRTASGIRSASTVVSCSGATAPTAGQVLTATSGTAAEWQTPSASSSYRQSVMARITSDTTTTSASFVDLITQAITLSASAILNINFTASISNSSVNKAVRFRILVDGVSQGGCGAELKSANVGCTAAFVRRVTGLASGSRTVKVQWKTSGGTAQVRPVVAIDEEHANLMLEEVGV